MPFKKIFETEALLHAQSDVVRVRDIGVFKVIGCFFCIAIGQDTQIQAGKSLTVYSPKKRKAGT